MNPLYNHLVKNNTKTISDHELSRWPAAQVEELKNGKHLRKAENSNRLYCDGCEESCPIDDYEVMEVPGKSPMAAFVCPEKKEMGFITASLSRRRQWRFIRPTRRKKASKVTPRETASKVPSDIEEACFVCLEDGVAFYSKGEFRKLPFQPNSHVLKVLPKLMDGSLTSKEVQGYAVSNDRPRSIVQNINRSILSRLHKAEFLDINSMKFIYYDQAVNSYKSSLPVITERQYKELKAKLSDTYYGG